VSAAVFACAALLGLGTGLLAPRRLAGALGAGATLAAALFNLGRQPVAETAYADYAVIPVHIAGQGSSRAFRVNSSTASLLDDSEPPNYARYVRHLRRVLLEELAFEGREILVLGAGGFTLSHREEKNRYTYVDIDPAIRALAEERFLKAPVRGEFIVDDARRFVATTPRRFDAVVVDVYSDHHSIPSHLVTREFWRDARRVLAPGGVLLANLILDPRLESPYARNVLATIDSVFGRCGVEVLQRKQPLANVEVICHAASQPGENRLYVDERNPADLDAARSR
jgi:SAM-dependent methyltransferase